MKLTQLNEVRYSNVGRVFEEYWVLYLPSEEGYAYFSTEHGVKTNEFPKRSGKFSSPEKALDRLSKWKKGINAKLAKIIAYRKTPLPRKPRRPRAGTGRYHEYWNARNERDEHERAIEDDRRFEDLSDQHDMVNAVVVTKVTVQAE